MGFFSEVSSVVLLTALAIFLCDSNYVTSGKLLRESMVDQH